MVNETGREIGQINYQKDVEEKEKDVYDLDIIIADKKDQNKGYGSAAIKLLTGHLSDILDLRNFSIYTLPENQRAVKSFRKAGFQMKGEFKDPNNIVWLKLTR
jgi:RimJ/RimL family protein N-acetyltransferase